MDFVLYTCSYGDVKVPTIASVEKLRNTGLRFEWWFQTEDALIARSRSIAASYFLKKNRAPYMIFLDGDIIFSPSDVQKIVDALNGGADVVGGLYPVKGAKYLAQRGWNGRLHLSGGIEEAQFVSTGFMGISRSILEKITKDMPLLNEGNWAECYPIFESGRYEKIYISEDWDFCNKARDAGATIYAHTGVQVDHLKDCIYTTQEAIRQTTSPKDEILKDLSEYLGKELIPQPEAVKQLAEKWNNWKGSAEGFYKDSEASELYLYDLAHFNASKGYREVRLSPVLNAHGANILDIGCGIGSALFELCWKNNRLVGYDLSEKALDFARYRAVKLRAKNVTFTNELPDVSDFDLILAIDTLEHIEDLRSFLIALGSRMKPGTKLYHADVFGKSDQHPMHFDHSENINAWLKEAGLAIFDTHWCVKP